MKEKHGRSSSKQEKRLRNDIEKEDNRIDNGMEQEEGDDDALISVLLDFL